MVYCKVTLVERDNMAEYYSANEFVDIEFDGDVQLNMSYRTIIGKVKTKELIKQVPELHQYFDAEQAIQFMHPDELEKLRSLIAPEIVRLNTEERLRHDQLEEKQSKVNIEHWQKLNALKHSFQTLSKEQDQAIKQLNQNNKLLSENIHMLKATLRNERESHQALLKNSY